MTQTLREYQEDCVANAGAFLGDCPLIVAPTGSGKSRISRACYFAPVLHSDFDPYEGCTLNGDGDEWLCPADWYEVPGWQNDDDIRHWRIPEKITHWMPLPEAPTS